jgi:outer membrane lipoprotein carrier protein
MTPRVGRPARNRSSRHFVLFSTLRVFVQPHGIYRARPRAGLSDSGGDYGGIGGYGRLFLRLKGEMRRFVLIGMLLLASVAVAQTAADAHTLAAKVDDHYNRLTSLRAAYTEHYSGMGQQRTENGTLLLRKPGRMRWTYSDGKLFVLDGKFATSYTPGDAQAERVPAKQLDDMRSPLRFLLGHTQLEKELDGLKLTPAADGAMTLAGTPHYAMSPGDQRVQRIAVTVQPASGVIVGLRVEEIDGTVTEFAFREIHENVPVQDGDFRFTPPAGVTVVDGMPPA